MGTSSLLHSAESQYQGKVHYLKEQYRARLSRDQQEESMDVPRRISWPFLGSMG